MQKNKLFYLILFLQLLSWAVASQAAVSEVETSAVRQQDSSATDQSPKIEIIFLLGDVQVKGKDDAEFKPAQGGMFISQGSTIKTSRGAFVELSFDKNNDHIVRVGENSIVIVVLKGDEKIELLQGEVFSAIKKLPTGSSFEIRTPTAIVGARGTEWTTKHNNEITEVEAFENSPFVKYIDAAGNVSDEETKVFAGYKTQIKRHQHPIPIQIVSQERKQYWQQMRDEIHQHILQSQLQRKQIPIKQSP